jgi:uncharacterized membrane protein YphA (DoxX/SURF4 family)
MNDQMSNRQNIGSIFAFLARWLLGVVVIYTGVSKALDPVSFLKLVQQYDVFRNYILLNSIAAILPWFEIFCGLLLMAGIAIRGTALILMVMLASFSGLVLNHALGIMSAKAIPFCAVKFDCGCGTGEVFACHKLPENFFLVILSIGLLIVPSNKFRSRSDV